MTVLPETIFISTISPQGDKKGDILRLESLLRLSESDKSILLVPSYFKKKPTKHNKIYIKYFHIRLIDILKIFWKIIIGYPISNAIFYRTKIHEYLNNYERKKKIFHTIRAFDYEYSKQSNIVIDYCESYSENFRLRSESITTNYLKKLIYKFDSKRLDNYEDNLLSLAEINFLFISHKDIKFKSRKNFFTFPNIFDAKDYKLRRGEEINLIFLGHVDYEPNLNSLISLGECLKLSKSSIEVRVVGKFSNQAKKSLSSFSNLSLYGYRKNIEDLIDDRSFGYSIMGDSTGMQNKVIDYLKFKVPIICNEEIAEAFPGKLPCYILKLDQNFVSNLGKIEKYDNFNLKKEDAYQYFLDHFSNDVAKQTNESLWR